jgi:hypothetical protein
MSYVYELRNTNGCIKIVTENLPDAQREYFKREDPDNWKLYFVDIMYKRANILSEMQMELFTWEEWERNTKISPTDLLHELFETDEKMKEWLENNPIPT